MNRDKIKIKIWNEDGPIFKEDGESTQVKKKLSEFFNLKL